MTRRWVPDRTKVRLEGVAYVTVVAQRGSADAPVGQEFRIQGGTIGLYDLIQFDRPAGQRAVRFYREGRSIRTFLPAYMLKGYQPGQHSY